MQKLISALIWLMTIDVSLFFVRDSRLCNSRATNSTDLLLCDVGLMTLINVDGLQSLWSIHHFAALPNYIEAST